MFSLLLALVFVGQVGQVDKNPVVPEGLKSLVFGTGLTVKAHQRKFGLVTEVETFTAGWDEGVIDRANKWANFARPNLLIHVEGKDGKWKIGEIFSAADPWERGGTPMHEVAREYSGKEVTMKTVNRLLADMKTAFHEHFAKE